MASKKLTRRRILLALVTAPAVLLIILARPLFHLTRTTLKDVDQLETLPPGFVDDASRLS